MFTAEDQIFGTLMAFREAANQDDIGITAVLCVAKNNALKSGTSFYSEVTKAFRYSSMNCPINTQNYVNKGKIKDIQQIINALSNFPKENNSIEWALWNKIKGIITNVLSNETEDITNGATLYYSTAMMSACPWDQSKVVFTTQIGSHRFYREV